MQTFTAHTGTAVPLGIANIDTDQIIPARHCLTTKRTGFADHLFARWREDPEFALLDPGRSSATILVGGPNFGSGSSREHAVWALQDWGFRAVIAPSFGDIFYANCGRAGLLPVRLEAPQVDALLEWTASPTAEISIDLEARSATWPGARASIDIDDETRERFLLGLDDIDITLAHESAIAAHETAVGLRSVTAHA